jgi:hypothetical protein
MGWVVSATPRPLRPWESGPVSLVQEAGWAPGPDERVRKISPPQGFELPTVQPVASRYTDCTLPAQTHTHTHKRHYFI